MPRPFMLELTPAYIAHGASVGVHFPFDVLALFAWLAALAWLRPLTAPDEGRYAGVALEMLRSRSPSASPRWACWPRG